MGNPMAWKVLSWTGTFLDLSQTAPITRKTTSKRRFSGVKNSKKLTAGF
jgi:hypothetical protein